MEGGTEHKSDSESKRSSHESLKQQAKDDKYDAETAFIVSAEIGPSEAGLALKKAEPNEDDNFIISDKSGTPNKKCCRACTVPEALSKWLPPRGFFGYVLTRVLICFVIWACLWAILGKNALPGGNFFSLVILLVTASFLGFLVRKIPYITFPPLLGMLIAGFLLRNVPGINVAKHIDKQWSSTLRNTALVVILLRSGLGLDIQALKRLKCTVARLAFCPCLLEAVVVAVVSHFLLGMPWLWAFMLGYETISYKLCSTMKTIGNATNKNLAQFLKNHYVCKKSLTVLKRLKVNTNKFLMTKLLTKSKSLMLKPFQNASKILLQTKSVIKL